MKSVTRGPSKAQRTSAWKRGLVEGFRGTVHRSRKRKSKCRCGLCDRNRAVRKLPLEE